MDRDTPLSSHPESCVAVAVIRAIHVVREWLSGFPDQPQPFNVEGCVRDAVKEHSHSEQAWKNLQRAFSLLGVHLDAVCVEVPLAFMACFCIYRTVGLDTAWLKGHLVALANQCLDAPLPPEPAPWKGSGERWGSFLTGKGYVLLQQMKRGRLSEESGLSVDEYRRFCGFSVLQMKGIFPEATDCFVRRSVEGCFKLLTRTTEQPRPDCTAAVGAEEFWHDQLQEEIFNQAYELGQSSLEVEFNAPMPSQSGHIDAKRAEGGAFAVLSQMVQNTVQEHLRTCTPVDPAPRCAPPPGWAPWPVEPFYWSRLDGSSCKVHLATWDALTIDQSCREHRVDEYEPLNQMLYDARRHAAAEDGTDVRLCGLKEPLKARVISAGNSYRYYVQKIVQKALHTALRRIPRFRLTGRPLTPLELDGMDPSKWRTSLGCDALEEPVGFNSGDYSDATNKILGWASSTAARGIAAAWRDAGLRDFEEWSGELLDGLTKNHIVAPLPTSAANQLREDQSKWEWASPTAVATSWENGTPLPWGQSPQTEGQLMGAPVSFPVLCVVNAAVITVAFRRWMYERGAALYAPDGRFLWTYGPRAGREIVAAHLPFLVNGDDCLMVCGESFMPVWEQLAKVVGLESTVGKSYFSTTWCIMNSAAYTLACGPPGVDWCVEHIFERHPFLPLGSMFCASKRGAERRELAGALGGDDLLNVVGPRARWAVEHCPASLRDAVLSAMIDYYQLPTRTPSGVSWWLPSVLGGLGLPVRNDLTDSEVYELVGRPALLRAAFAVEEEVLAPVLCLAGWEQRVELQSDARPICEFVLQRTEESPCDPFSGLCHPQTDYSPLLLGYKLNEEGADDVPLTPAVRDWMAEFDLDASTFVSTRRAEGDDVDQHCMAFIAKHGVFDAIRDPSLNPLYSIRIDESPTTAAWSFRYRGLSPARTLARAPCHLPPAFSLWGGGTETHADLD